MRELKPCGTRAAYLRHLRAGERVDEACAAASRAAKNARMAAKRHRSNAAVTLAIAEAPTIEVIVELDEILDNLRIVKAAMETAPASAIASLSKCRLDLTAHVLRLQQRAAKPKENALDELARRRAERLSNG